MPPRDRQHPWAIEFGRLFWALRDERRWNLRTAAAHLTLNPTYLSMLEKGTNMPSIDTLRWFASVYGIPASELLRRVERAVADREAATKAMGAPSENQD